MGLQRLRDDLATEQQQEAWEVKKRTGKIINDTVGLFPLKFCWLHLKTDTQLSSQKYKIQFEAFSTSFFWEVVHANYSQLTLWLQRLWNGSLKIYFISHYLALELYLKGDVYKKKKHNAGLWPQRNHYLPMWQGTKFRDQYKNKYKSMLSYGLKAPGMVRAGKCRDLWGLQSGGNIPQEIRRAIPKGW